MKQVKLCLALLSICVPSFLAAQNTVVKEVPVRGTHTLEGSDLFSEYCAVCHGKDEKGGGPAAVALNKRPSDLTQLARKNGGKFDALAVQLLITGSDVVAAHGSRDMPTWGTVFASMSSDDGVRKLRINGLVNYIEKMQAK
jgi:mono/diheme cytochrome c family protein